MKSSIILAAVCLLSNALAEPKPDPQSQFMLANSQSSPYDKDFLSNINKYMAQYNAGGGGGVGGGGQEMAFNGMPVRRESPNLQYQYQLYNDVDKQRNHHSSAGADKHHSEFQHLYPKHIRPELIVHRSSPIIVNRKPTKLLINHAPIVVRPAPVVFHRAPQAIRPVISYNPRPQPPSPALRIQPVFVNINRKKPNQHPNMEYVPSSRTSDDDWYKNFMSGGKGQPTPQYNAVPDDDHHHHSQHVTNSDSMYNFDHQNGGLAGFGGFA